MIRELYGTVLGIGVALVALVISGAVVSSIFNTVNQTAPSAILTTLGATVTTIYTTLGGFLPVVVMAIVGGMALFYIISYLR